MRRQIIWHRSAALFGAAYGAEAQAEYERLKCIMVPWVASVTKNGLRFRFGSPYRFRMPKPLRRGV